jgi:hypothetical protein
MDPRKASEPATESVIEPRASDQLPGRIDRDNTTKLEARQRNHRRLKGEADGASSIYVGRDLAGTISWQAGVCSARR